LVQLLSSLVVDSGLVARLAIIVTGDYIAALLANNAGRGPGCEHQLALAAAIRADGVLGLLVNLIE